MAARKSKKLGKHLSHHTPTEGLAFIGDPHVWSHKPGRRRDEDYLTTILNKIVWIAQYCNSHNLQAIILGDLLHESTDNDLNMISRLVAVLQNFDRTPLVLVGNHDISQTSLTAGTVLHLLHHTGQIDAMTKNGPHATIDLTHDGVTQSVLIGGTPYGENIPVSLKPWISAIGADSHDSLKAEAGVDKVVWITHDDLAFDSSYPNSIALHPIMGVDICVNGHMHRTQKPVQKGNTAWYNPGNINRLTIDLLDQTPKIWVYYANDTRMEAGADGLPVPLIEGVEIPHAAGADILSLEGRISTLEQNQATLLAQMDEPQPSETLLSKFVEQMKQDEAVARTDDGVFLAQVIDDEFAQLQPPPRVKDIVSRLFEQALIQHRGNQ